ncbi:MAG: hypothetical protein L6R37_006401 [Teloschistes peruensis]|nr:MAG: hypothetical protein L6R37_006401 [Teloschistes peruensis]
MTLDRLSKTSDGRSQTNTSVQRWAAKSTQISSHARLQTSTPSPTLRKEGLNGKLNGSVADHSDDATTPVKPLLSSNITPRSGSRKARVESASSTPRRTPESNGAKGRPVSMIEGQNWSLGASNIGSGSGTGGGNVSRPERSRSVISDAQSSSTRQDRESWNASLDAVPKFFHADETKALRAAKVQPQSSQSQPRLVDNRYMYGTATSTHSSRPSSPQCADDRPKFVYANGTQEDSSPAPRLINGTFGTRPPLQTIFSSYQTTTPTHRPPSPLKEEVLPVSRKSSLNKPSPRRHTRLVSSGSSGIRAPESITKGPSDISRRSSLNEPNRRITQPQSPVISTRKITSSRRSSIALSDSGRDPTLMLSPEPQSTELSPIIYPPTSNPEPSPPQSPSKAAPGQSKLDHLNELAANARRERKVLDLEISNSSLLAINRTLETEMRKQKAELRLFRRLRSSGHFPASSRSASSRFSMPSTSDDLSPTSSADEDYLDDDRFSNVSGTSDDTSFPDSLSFSPTPRNSTAPFGKGRQSRAFKLDLSAQRALLLDSQKLNQALKRCLSRTDELIADGKKALSYSVDVGQANSLGPRVLTPDERDGEIELGRGLLSPGVDEKHENPWDRAGNMEDARPTPQFDGPEKDNLEDNRPPPGSGDHARQSAEVQNPDVLGISYPNNNNKNKDAVLETRHNIPSAEQQDTLDAKYRDIISTLENHQDHTTLTLTASPPEEEPPEPVSTSSYLPARKDDTLDIPYEDPGIDTDTGGEVSEALEEEETMEALGLPPSLDPDRNPKQGDSVVGSSREGSESEGEVEEAEEKTAKGLGGFLRLVGGSWGV